MATTPPRTRLDDDKFMAVWDRMDPVIQRELLRAERELLEGTAIEKDRMLGRPKKSAGGFYALERLEAEIYELEQVGRKAPELAKARDEFAKLRAALAADAERVEEIVSRNEGLEEFEQHAAAHGLTLAQYIQKCRNIEQTLSRDLLGGLFEIAEWIGFDLIELLQAQLAKPDNRRAAH